MHRPGSPDATARSRSVLDAIAVFKFVKAAALFSAGLGALGLIDPHVERWAAGWLERLALDHGTHLLSAFAERAIPVLGDAVPRRLAVVAVGAFLYGAVFLTEGIGLVRGRRWAEYLTVGSTISFLPLEALAVAHKHSAPRAVTLALNVCVVVYLVWRLGSRASRR